MLPRDTNHDIDNVSSILYDFKTINISTLFIPTAVVAGETKMDAVSFSELL